MDGTEDDPITLRGEYGVDPEDVILKGEDDRSRVLEILHSYYIIEVKPLVVAAFCCVVLL